MKSSQKGGEEESTLWRKELTAAQYDILAGAVTLSAYPNCPHRVQVLFSEYWHLLETRPLLFS